jgi:error-prone DNA polymerase
VKAVDGIDVDVDTVPRDDPKTFHLVQSTKTLGCFQIESPGQRELIGKFGPTTFEDLITDISLFRPGPVKSDMVRPFLLARNGWNDAVYLHEDLRPALEQTYGVVVFHEQVLMIVATMTGCTLAEADEVRRTLGSTDGQEEIRVWYFPRALAKGYEMAVVEQVWEVLKAFASFGFCKAHAAAFALPTYQSTYLKAHHPAAFLAGVLTHDPGMYPKRLILDDARQFGIAILSLDVNASESTYTVEKVGFLDEPPPAILGAPPRSIAPDLDLPDGRGHGIRIGLADVRGINDAEVARIVAGRPYASLSDFWHRAAVSRPIVERLVIAGGFDSLYGLGSTVPGRRRGQVTRRDLLLQVAELDRWSRALQRGQRGQPRATKTAPVQVFDLDDVKGRQAKQSQQAAAVGPVDMQLALDLGDAPEHTTSSGLPEMTQAERTRAELDVLGLDVSSHVLEGYAAFLAELGVTRATDLLGCRSSQGVLVAGVKVATQTPPIRSGRRVVFVTLDDSTGPVDATFFEQAQVGYASTIFHSWLLVIKGEVRRTGPRGISLLALGAWELPVLHNAWQQGGLEAVWQAMDGPGGFSQEALEGAAASRSARPVVTRPPVGGAVQVYASGFLGNPYADIKPAGSSATTRKLWHASPGSSGR